MPHRDPFKGHRFPKDVILLAVRWYCRFPLSYRDVRDRDRSKLWGQAALNNGGVGLMKLAMLSPIGCFGT